MQDLHNNVKVVRAIEPKAVGTTGSSNGVTGPVIDRRGYQAVEFILNYGAPNGTTEHVYPVVLEGDTTDGSFTSVADVDLIGTEDDAHLASQASARTSGTGKNVSKKIGYRGNKDYLKLQMWASGTATCLVSATAVLYKARHAPVS